MTAQISLSLIFRKLLSAGARGVYFSVTSANLGKGPRLIAMFRTLLILGRISNLPTVWSNLLAAWIITRSWKEGVAYGEIALLLLSGTFLYIGGMYFNDFCDESFDRQYCPQRPIPSGKISRVTVGVLSLGWFLAGLACAVPLGGSAMSVALLLTACVVLYDVHHKGVSWAPLLMGSCRFLLYPFAALAAGGYFYDYIWVWGLTLGFYVAGITYLARGESRRDRLARWALLLLLLPLSVQIAVGLLWGMLIPASLGFSLLFLGWMAWLLIPLWRKTNQSIGRVVSGLLAGVVLVDMIGLAPFLGWQALALLPFFLLSLFLQRFIPAT